MHLTFGHAANITAGTAGDLSRDRIPHVGRSGQSAAASVRTAKHQTTQRRASSPLPVTASARAAAVFKEEFDKWEIQIEAVRANPSLTPEQRTASISALRIRQRIEAAAVRNRVMREEKQKARALRRDRASRLRL